MSDTFDQVRDLVLALPGHDLWHRELPGAALGLGGRRYAVVHRRAPGARLRVVARFDDLEAVQRWVSQAPTLPR